MGIINHFIFKIIMRSLFIILSLLFSSLSFAISNDGIFAHIETNKGKIIVELAYKKTPLTVINFIALSEGTKKSNKELGTPFYDGLSFHRVIDDFMIQGGDPKGNGTGGPGYRFADEFSDLIHDKPGILSMANSGPATNGSQFFITHIPTPWLDGKHTVFGHVVDGMDVVNSIIKGDTLKTIKIVRVGDDANNFIANEESFNSLLLKANEGLIAQQAMRQAEFENFALTSYPDATRNNFGHFVKIDKQGGGKKALSGQLVSVDVAFKANSGEIMRAAGTPIEFSLGSGEIIMLIEANTLEMLVGEERTILATYESVFGDAPSGNIPQDAFIIFDLILLSAKDK